MVSISTVARTEPCGTPSSLLRRGEDVVPEPRLEMRFELRQVVVRAGAAREQLHRVVEEVQAEVEQAPRHRPAVEEHVLLVQVPAARARDEHRRAARSAGSACRTARGRSSRRTASIRFAWPETMLSQVGQFASSKSAMNVEAPELSALITILRSVGPVISTRRSSRSGGWSAIFQSDSRIDFVSGRKSGMRPASNSRWRSERRAQQLAAPRLEFAAQRGDECERLGGEHAGEFGWKRGRDPQAGGQFDPRFHGAPLRGACSLLPYSHSINAFDKLSVLYFPCQRGPVQGTHHLRRSGPARKPLGRGPRGGHHARDGRAAHRPARGAPRREALQALHAQGHAHARGQHLLRGLPPDPRRAAQRRGRARRRARRAPRGGSS